MRGTSILVGSIAVGIYAVPTVWSSVRNPHHLRGWDRWLWAGVALGGMLLFILWVAGALPPGETYD